MKYLVLLLLGAGIAFGQSATSSAVLMVSSNPNGVACITNTSKARLYHSILYTCQSNAFAVVASGGGAPTGSAGGDLSGTYPNPNVAKINGTALSGLATGVLKNTTTTGVPSIAVAADITPLLAAFTGDCTTSAGATAIICTKTNSVAFAASATTDTTVATNIGSGTLPAGRMPALTGDITTSAGAVATTLASVNGGSGACGDATHVCAVTTNAKGLTTSQSATAITYTHPISAAFDGGGAALVAGRTVYFTIPYACTIQAWNITVDAGTATFDVWRLATGSAIPTISNTLTASAAPAIASGTALHSTTMTGWTTTLAKNDIVALNLKTVATATLASLVLECREPN